METDFTPLWKLLIIFTFALSLTCFISIVISELPKYEYYTKKITLDDSNDFSIVDGKIIDYICDEGVYFQNYGDSYYASTWYGDHNVKLEYRGSSGECIIKIRRRI